MEKAIAYLAAGMSKRFNGEIKQLTIVGKNNESLIEVSLNQALKAGFNKIVFIVGNKTEMPFKKTFGNEYKGVPIIYAYQYHDETKRDKPWGTTEALCTIKGAIDCPFLICNGDELFGENTLKKMLDSLELEEEATVGYPLGDMVPAIGKVNRGVFTVENGYVKKIKEHLGLERSTMKNKGLKENDLCNVNLFALNPKVLDLLSEKLAQFKKENAGNRECESLLPVDISDLIVQGKIKMKIHPSENKWIGITNPGDEIKVREFLKNNQD